MIHSLVDRSKLKSSSIWKGEKIDFKDFYFPPSIFLRHYIEQTGTTGNSGGVYTLTVADVEGKDRGTIPISITGPDKQEHVANIKIYVIGTSKYVKWYTYYILCIWYVHIMIYIIHMILYILYILYIRCISRVVGWGNDWMQGRAVRAYSYVRCLVYWDGLLRVRVCIR